MQQHQTAQPPVSADWNDWLCQQLGEGAKPRLLFADASNRCYYRVTTTSAAFGSPSLVLMYAPPQLESLRQFVDIAEHWAQHLVRTPEVYATNYDLGIALIEDFGDFHLASVAVDERLKWYKCAQSQLDFIHSINPEGLPNFVEKHFWHEMQLLPQWVTGIELDAELWHALCEKLLDKIQAMPQRTCHRDFHSRNLMLLSAESDKPAIGVIDFQDACVAPACYDLVSIVFDAYVDLAFEVITALINHQAERLDLTPQQLTIQMLCVALQRLLKVYAIFCRLKKRDNKPQYLSYLPRVARSLVTIGQQLEAHGEDWVEPHQGLLAQLVAHAHGKHACER